MDTLIPLNPNQTDSGSESAFIGSWGSSSSSSFLTASFGSELDSNDTDPDNAGDQDEFIAELTRKMTDYMLEEEDVVHKSPNDSESSKPNFQEPNYGENQGNSRRSYADTVKKSIVGFQQEQSFSGDKRKQSPPIQLYQLENQPRVGWGSKGKLSESTHSLKPHRHEQKHNNININNRGGYAGHGSAAGMRAIFLGGSASRNGSAGTGVFLPRSAVDATDRSRKKPGCSTVLVPARVLQALEQHFNKMESLLPIDGHTHPTHQVTNDNTQAQSQGESVSLDHQKSKLPQEWIY